ncbi:hypothetical protein Bbelb_337060 [Branchiostoma belcheri]|nr:hypothetical protein Bbelb_337060 [Branchiostoma belcheri]
MVTGGHWLQVAIGYGRSLATGDRWLVQADIGYGQPMVTDSQWLQRLQALQLPTLNFRRQRTDVIQLYKITHGYDKKKNCYRRNYPKCGLITHTGYLLTGYREFNSERFPSIESYRRKILETTTEADGKRDLVTEIRERKSSTVRLSGRCMGRLFVPTCRNTTSGSTKG